MATSDDGTIFVQARGMKCPWPALRAARAMREADAILIEADDPIAPSELAALARQQGWTFAHIAPDRFTMQRKSGSASL